MMSLARPKEALEELLILRDVVPDEPNVWFLMGRLYKTLRLKAEAVRAFTMALNLDPKVIADLKLAYMIIMLTISRLHSISRTPWKLSTTKTKTTMTRMRT